MAFRPGGDSDSYSSDDFEFGDQYVPYDQAGYGRDGGEDAQKLEESWRSKAFKTESGPGWEGGTKSDSALDNFRTALFQGDLEQVSKAILDDRMDMDHQFTGLYCAGTPLVIAATMGHVDVVEFLLKQGASLQPDQFGITPFMAICQVTSSTDLEDRLEEVANLFLNLRPKEIKLDQIQNQGTTALMFAAKEGHLRLVKLLVKSGATVNYQDTQYWTALCFAADQGHGDVARFLLENGANPDLATKEGLKPCDIAGSRHYTELSTVIDSFSDPNPSQKNKSIFLSSSVVSQMTDLDDLLLGLLDIAPHYIGLFKEHEITLEIFLGLTDQDLIDIGIKELGIRKRIVSAIADIHQRDWEKTSVPRISPRDKQRGIHFTAPDCVSITANLGEHARFMSMNVNFLKNQLAQHPELLTYGQDTANIDTILHHVTKAKKNIANLHKNINLLESVTGKLSRNPIYQPADKVKPSAKSLRFSNLLLPMAFVGGAISFVVSMYKYIY